MTSEFKPHPIADGVTEVGGKKYMADAKGALVPVELIKAQVMLEDETVRKIMGFAVALSDQISRFKGHTVSDLGEFDALLARNTNFETAGRRATGPTRPMMAPSRWRSAFRTRSSSARNCRSPRVSSTNA